MPQKNSIKEYEENAYYHIYNRGVEKRIIFQDEQDCKVFLSYLKLYLTPPNLQGDALKASPSRQLQNYSDQIQLLSYCLMPNHFHFLVKQKSAQAIKHFMISLCTKYTMYFNKKYNRVGKLYQGPYKAVKVTTNEQLLYLTKYIHRNPQPTGRRPEDYKYSSYSNYLGKINQTWVKTDEILSFFSTQNPHSDYQAFVEEKDESNLIKDLTLE